MGDLDGVRVAVDSERSSTSGRDALGFMGENPVFDSIIVSYGVAGVTGAGALSTDVSTYGNRLSMVFVVFLFLFFPRLFAIKVDIESDSASDLHVAEGSP